MAAETESAETSKLVSTVPIGGGEEAEADEDGGKPENQDDQ
jgi:hypothetical protein